MLYNWYYEGIIMNGNDAYYSIDIERDELDTNFGGGLPKNSLILIEGPDGAGKSLLCQRFIHSLLKNGESVTYISSELNTLDFINQMESLNYSIQQGFLDQTILFISMVPFLGKVKFENNFLEKIINSKKIFENDIIIFDTLSFLMVKPGAPKEEYYDIINFFRKLNNLNKTVIFTVDPGNLDEIFLNMLRNVVDLLVEVQLKLFAGDMIRSINIKRFKRPRGVYKPAIPFRVEPKEGLIIEIGGYA